MKSSIIRRALSFSIVVAIGMMVACKGSGRVEAADQEQKGAKAPSISVAQLSEYVLTYYSEKGMQIAAEVADIPAASRAFVRLTAKKPIKEMQGVIVADLSDAKRVNTRLLSREAFEHEVGKRTGASEALKKKSIGVVLYSTDWCGVCKKTAKFLRANNIPFVEKNVEKDKSARKEMADKAHAQGLAPTGVPVIDAKGKILLGFDEARLRDILLK